MKKDKITKLLLWHVNDSCNLACSYCSTAREREVNPVKTSTVDIPKLKKLLDSTDDTYIIVFTGGGEPFLANNFVEACELISQKHYLAINTNLTSSKVKEFASKVNPKKVRYIVSSMHIEELKKRGQIDRFIENYLTLKNKGFNIQAREVAHPSLIEKVDEYRELFSKQGVEILFDPFIGRYNRKVYPKSYTSEELKFLGIKKKEIKKFYTKRSLCNAGYNAAAVNAKGDVSVCLDLMGAKLGNIYDGFEFNKTCIRCPLDFCSCPLYDIEESLLKDALKHKPKFSLKPYFAAWQEKHDRRLGSLGRKIKKTSPKFYLFLKKMEKRMGEK